MKSKSLDKLVEWLKTEEGKADLEEFFAEKKKEQDNLDGQLHRFHKDYSADFDTIVEKVIKKYESDEYKDRWYNRGIEPPCDLYWFLFYYAEKYGDECTPEGRYWKEYGNMFTSAMYQINGYTFQRMDGQGSVIKINRPNFRA